MPQVIPPETCPICGAGNPVPMELGADQRRKHMQALWRYDCGHRYAVYAPDESGVRQVVRQFYQVRVKAHGGRGRSGRRKSRDKAAQARQVVPLDLLPNPRPPRPILRRVCPCGVEFVTRDPRQVYHDKTCRLRFEKQRQRARKVAAGGTG